MTSAPVSLASCCYTNMSRECGRSTVSTAESTLSTARKVRAKTFQHRIFSLAGRDRNEITGQSALENSQVARANVVYFDFLK